MLSFRLKKLNYIQKREETQLHISGIGLREVMEPARVNRPMGTRDRLLMVFHTPVELKEEGEWQTYPAGTLRLWKDQAGHFYGNGNQVWSHSWIHFYGPFAEQVLGSVAFDDEKPFFLADSAAFESALEALYEEWNHPEQDFSILKALFEILIRTTMRSLHSKPIQIPERLQVLKDALDASPEKKMNLPEMASFCRMSRAEFCMQFKKYYGESPGHYLLKHRFDYVMLQLLDHTKNISDIAEECSYSSVQAFSKAFRHYAGCPPSEWKRK